MQTFGWADKIAQELLKRNKETYVFHGMWTPSGFFHIGNARSEVFTPYAAKHALESYNKKCIQNFIIDDFDVIRKIPLGLNIAEKDYEEYLGYPCALAKSPLPGFKTWAEAFVSNVKEFLPKYGIKVNYISAYETYKAGIFNYAIKISLDNAKKIVEIWNKIANANKPESFLPIQVLCPKCKKLTTEAKEWLADAEEVSFVCKNPNCKYEGVISPYNGNAKLHWRVHWAAHWHYYKVDFESGGKDHFAAGGSVDVSRAFLKEIFKCDIPPLGVPTEFVQVGGKKMAGSVGNVISLDEWLKVGSAELFRFLNFIYRPQTVIELSLSHQNFLLLYERFERAERIYFGLEEAENEKLTMLYKRAYELSILERKKRFYQAPFSTLLQLVQFKELDEIPNILKTLKVLPSDLTPNEERNIIKKAERAKYWLEHYAPETLKIKFAETYPKPALNENELQAVKKAIKAIEGSESIDALQKAFFQIKKEHNIDAKRFFGIFYNVLIAKDSGPKLATLIFALGRERVIKRLNELIASS